MSAEENAGSPRGRVHAQDMSATVVRELTETRGDLLGGIVLGEVGDQEDVGEGGLLEGGRGRGTLITHALLYS